MVGRKSRLSDVSNNVSLSCINMRLNILVVDPWGSASWDLMESLMRFQNDDSNYQITFNINHVAVSVSYFERRLCIPGSWDTESLKEFIKLRLNQWVITKHESFVKSYTLPF